MMLSTLYIDRVAALLRRDSRGSGQRSATASVRRGIAGLLLFASSAIAQQSQRTFTFKQTPQGPLEVTVDYPADWKPTEARPAIVFFFGGEWTKGSVEQFSRQAAYFATRGMVAIRADYRIASTHHTEPDAAVEDGRTALRWVRRHANEFGIDPNRIVAAGGSAGGHLAACTAQCPVGAPAGEDSTVSPRPNALILFDPALDYAGLGQLPAPFSNVFRAFPRLMQDTALQSRISPVLHVERGAPPTLLLFGTDDPRLQAIEGDIRSRQSVADAIAGVRGAVNAVSLYIEHGKETFHSVHVDAAQRVAVRNSGRF